MQLDSMAHFGLLILSLILCSLNQAASETVYYITTNSTDLCTVQLEPCLTLSQFATDSTHYLHSNTTLVFLPGIHYLSKINLTLSNVDSFVMMSKNSTTQILIKCTNDSHIHFYQSQCIHIINLEFIGCGANQVKHIENFVIKDTKFKGQKNSGTALELLETTAQIVNSIFISSRNGSYRKCPAGYDCTVTQAFVGGAIIATNSTIDISQSKFEDNRADYGGAIFAEQNSIINLSSNVLISNNTANRGGGVLFPYNSTITIKASIFQNNTATNEGGILLSYYSTITIKASTFQNNTAVDIGSGGVVSAHYSNITIEASKFDSNSATESGGVLNSDSSSIITIEASKFDSNSATESGGVLNSDSSSIITIEASKFDSNSATESGGVLNSYRSIIKIESSQFHKNSAGGGGVLNSDSSNISIATSEVYSNSATHWGGVLYSYNSTITIFGSNFTENNSSTGAVIYATVGTKVQYCIYLLIDNNSANDNSVIYLSDSEFKGCDSGNVTISNNLGSLVIFNSNITFNGYVFYMNNQPAHQITIDDFQKGGAITLFQSNMFFDGECTLEHNHAENGGAIQSTESKLYINGNVTIAHNTATGNGGGVYLSTSELNCQQKCTFVLFNNTAAHKGGGLHAISSFIKATFKLECYNNIACLYTGTSVNFTNNAANWGGGLSLEANAKLYILKYNVMQCNSLDCVLLNDINTATFTGNSADYGGAVYVDDDTNSGTCANTPRTECFFQVLALYNNNGIDDPESDNIIVMPKSIYFSKNTVNTSGSTLYGGLLDRCAVNQFAEVYQKYAHNDVERGGGIAYIRNVSIATKMSISSRPV